LSEECVEDILGERQHVPDFKIYVIDQIGRERIETSANVVSLTMPSFICSTVSRAGGGWGGAVRRAMGGPWE
jgi:hypothetical protein